MNIWVVRTRRKTLLQLLGLFWVIDGEGVEVPRTPQLELGLLLAARNLGRDFLYPGL